MRLSANRKDVINQKLNQRVYNNREDIKESKKGSNCNTESLHCKCNDIEVIGSISETQFAYKYL